MRKRQKSTHNFFVDDEAGHSENASDYEEVDEEEIEFSSDEDIVSIPSHRRGDNQLTDHDNVQYWHSFIERAEARGRNAGFEYDSRQSSMLEGNERLWEIGCRVGQEEAVVFKAMSRATHPSDPHLLAKSVIGRCSIPGRVFVEVHSEADARSFAMSIAQLNPNAVRIVPVEEMVSVLYIKNPFSFDNTNWARLTGRGAGWRIYKGDIAMVVPQNGVKFLLVIPRIKTADSINNPRPQQSLFPAHVLMNLFGAACISTISPNGSFSFQGKRMTKEGFLYQNLSEADVFMPGDDFPTNLELETFKACSFMDDKILNEATSHLSRLKIALDARVVVVAGDYIGLVGRVIEIGENEVAVDVESQDHIERVHLSAVRMAFRLGDQVQITRGPHSGRNGWIVDVQDHIVTIINVEQEIEVSVKKSDVIFYNSPFITTLRKRTVVGDIKSRGHDPNKIYRGKRVIVVGGNSYKGYKGIIKDTTLEGYAWVELDARLQQPEKISLDGLAFLSKDEITLTATKIPEDGRRNTIPLASGSALPSGPANFGSATPIPEVTDESGSDDAWNPNSATPRAQCPIHWLNHTKLQNTRLKLFVLDKPSEILEFKGVHGDRAEVREGRRTKFVSLEELFGVRPTAKGELVTATTGSLTGIALKVREYRSEECVVRQPGKVLRKHETDPTLANSVLVQIFPYIK